QMPMPGMHCCWDWMNPVSSTNWPHRWLAYLPCWRLTRDSRDTKARLRAIDATGRRRRPLIYVPGRPTRPIPKSSIGCARRPDPEVFNGLWQARRAAGRLQEAEQFGRKIQAARKARAQLRAVYDEANADKTLGIAPHPDLFHRLADLRELMGREDEALAWHSL